MTVMNHAPTAVCSAAESGHYACDICGQAIIAGERYSYDGAAETAHAACVRDWFRRNFGREGLS